MDPESVVKASISAAKLAAGLIALFTRRSPPRLSDIWRRYARYYHYDGMHYTPFGKPPWALESTIRRDALDGIREHFGGSAIEMKRFATIDNKTFHALHPGYKDGETPYMGRFGELFLRGYSTLFAGDKPAPPEQETDSDVRDYKEFARLCGWAVWQLLLHKTGWPPGPRGDQIQALTELDKTAGRIGSPRAEDDRTWAKAKMVYDLAAWVQGPICGYDDRGRPVFERGAWHLWQKLLKDDGRVSHVHTQAAWPSNDERERLQYILDVWLPLTDWARQDFARRMIRPEEYTGIVGGLTKEELSQKAAKWYGPPVPWAFRDLWHGEIHGDTASPFVYAALFPRLFYQYHPAPDKSIANTLITGEFRQ